MSLAPLPPAAPRTVGAWGQLRALTGLRTAMVRSRRGRAGLLVGGLTLPLLLVGVVVVARSLPELYRLDAGLLLPTAFLGFAALALVAPLTAGGGNELFPPDELVAYPVRPPTVFAASVLVAPLNLVWVSQLLVLVGLAAYVVPAGGLVWPALVLTGAYVVAITVGGQALSWAVVGVRATRRGRRATWALAGAAVVLAVVATRTGATGELLDRSPTLRILGAVLRSSQGTFSDWTELLVGLTALTALAALAGTRAVAWSLRRPSDAAGAAESRPVRRRGPRRSVLAELVAMDRASVWRSASLRRGALVLGALPGLVAAGAGVGWESLAILPGLVAAGAGLLFGVNAFCLDASGAVWLASLPHPGRTALLAKAVVLTETVVVAVLLALLAGVARAPGLPTSAQAVGVVMAAVTTTALVVASCLRLSVRRPHRADLRGPRDTPAPPATMAGYSARLAATTTLVGVVVAAASVGRFWWTPLVPTLPLLAYAALSLRRTVRHYDDPVVRARVTATVAAG